MSRRRRCTTKEKEATKYSKGRKVWISGNFWGRCGRRKRATQIELKPKRYMLHTHTLASDGVGVWPATARGWEQPVFSPSAGSGLRSPYEPEMPELCLAARCQPGRLTIHQERGKERAKLLQKFTVQILQVSRLDRLISRLISAATEPGTQPD